MYHVVAFVLEHIPTPACNC